MRYRSRFATSTVRECTVVLDPPSPRLRRDKPPGAEARREIDRDAPPPFRFLTARTYVSYRRMQREARSGFATSTGRECTIVLDPPSPRLRRDKPLGAGARREIARDAPPPMVMFSAAQSEQRYPEEEEYERDGFALEVALVEDHRAEDEGDDAVGAA